MSQSYTLNLEDEPNPADVQFIWAGLQAYNLLHAADDNYRSLTIFLRAADQTLVGGLLGATYWGWLHIDILWLHESVRRQGFGGQILLTAEQEAIRRGCHYAHLDTLSFQALPFYEQHGYTIFGVLPDLPAGHSRYFLKKELKLTD